MKSKIFLLLIISLFSYIKSDEGITVHVVAHSHDDVGWLFKARNYYSGNNNFGQCVHCILDSVLLSLNQNPNRTFTEVEMYYFHKWYVNLTKTDQDSVKQLVKEKRLEFTNAGWSMHDEADTTYQDQIDNMRIGLKFLKEEFDYDVETGWSIDPFGHSITNAALFAKLGFKNFVIVRIDQKDKDVRKKTQNLEFVWKPFYEVDGGKTEIFTHVMAHHYNPDQIFPTFITDQIVVTSFEQVEAMVPKILSWAKISDGHYKSKNILMLYGDDFRYKVPYDNYINIEWVMNYFNARPELSSQVKFIYSTPSKYFNLVKNLGIKYDEYRGLDFFPYADQPYAYWSGYFSSRPYLKGLVRDSSNYLKRASNLFFEKIVRNLISNVNLEFKSLFFNIRNEMGIAQHHDAVTGTEKELVAEDYQSRLNLGNSQAKSIINSVLLSLANNDTNFEASNVNICIPASAENQCNDKIYQVSANDTYFILVNPGRLNTSYYPFEIAFNNSNVDLYKFGVEDLIPITNDIMCESIPQTICIANFFLEFQAEDLIQVIIARQNLTRLPTQKILIDTEKTYDIFTSEKNVVTYNYLTGVTITDPTSASVTTYIPQHSFIINNLPGSFRPPNSNPSGAYIMATTYLTTTAYEIDELNSYVYEGELVTQFYIKYSTSIMKLKFFKNDELAKITEVKSLIYPLSFFLPDYPGLEFFLELNTNINNSLLIPELSKEEPHWWTDSNGIFMLRRIKDFRTNYDYQVTEPFASNFYPVGKAMTLREIANKTYVKGQSPYEGLSSNDRTVTVVNDRAQAGGAMNQGQILLDIDRWSEYDDGRGLGGPLREKASEDEYFPVKHYIVVNDLGKVNHVQDFLEKRPIVANILNAGDSVLKTLSNLINEKSAENEIFGYQGDSCLDINVYTINLKSAYVTFFNKNDPFFTSASKCAIILKNDSKYTFTEVSLNTLNIIQKQALTKKSNLKKLGVEEMVLLGAQDWKTYLFEINQ